MHDYQAQIEKLRRGAAEGALIHDLTADKAKREVFDRLATYLAHLADQVEVALLENQASQLRFGGNLAPR